MATQGGEFLAKSARTQDVAPRTQLPLCGENGWSCHGVRHIHLCRHDQELVYQL